MRGTYYRLNSSTLAILIREDEQKIPITIPEGAIVEALAGSQRFRQHHNHLVIPTSSSSDTGIRS
jgi:hypothetical protein